MHVEVPILNNGIKSIPSMVALAVAIEKLGGDLIISQNDLDSIAGKFIVEGWTKNEQLILTINLPTENND